VAFYSEAFEVTAVEAHPRLMGSNFSVGWLELWEGILPMFDQAQHSGRTIDMDKIELIAERKGFKEEAYFTGQSIPLRGDSGEVEGFYNTVSGIIRSRVWRGMLTDT